MLERCSLWIVLALAAFAFYLATSNGIVGSNDGSHMALVRAIVDDGTFSIDRHFDLVQRIDFAEYNGRMYSDRPPGTAFLTLPYYAALRWIGHRFFSDPTHFIYVAIPALPAVAGAANVLLVGALARLGGARAGWAFFAAGLFAVGTVQWRYGTALFSHTFSTFAVLSASYIVLRSSMRGDRLTSARGVVTGLIVGASLMLDYLTIVLAAGVGVFLWRGGLLGSEAPLWRRWAPLALAGAVPVFLLLVYQWVCFDNAFSTSYSHHARFTWARSAGTTFTNNVLTGWANYFLVVLENKNPGDLGGDGGVLYPVLQTGPLLLAGFWGFFVLGRSRRREAAFLAALIGLGVTVTAAHKTYWGGGTADTRYILPWLALLAPGVAWALQDVWRRLAVRWRAPAAVILAALTVFTVFQHLRMQASFMDHADGPVAFRSGSFREDLRRIDVVWDHAFGFPEHVRGLAGKLK